MDTWTLFVPTDPPYSCPAQCQDRATAIIAQVLR